MPDLILRPARPEAPKPWALQLRFSDMAETNYHTLCYVTEEQARDIIEAGKPYWLFGDPAGDGLKAETGERRMIEMMKSLAGPVIKKEKRTKDKKR